MTIIAALFLTIFRRWLGATRSAPAAGFAIALYTVLVGAYATVVLAAIKWESSFSSPGSLIPRPAVRSSARICIAGLR